MKDQTKMSVSNAQIYVINVKNKCANVEAELPISVPPNVWDTKQKLAVEMVQRCN